MFCLTTIPKRKDTSITTLQLIVLSFSEHILPKFSPNKIIQGIVSTFFDNVESLCDVKVHFRCIPGDAMNTYNLNDIFSVVTFSLLAATFTAFVMSADHGQCTCPCSMFMIYSVPYLVR